MSTSVVGEAVQRMVNQRDWAQFHSPENLAKSIVIEAAELLECFQWGGDTDRDRIAGELADVLTYCLLLATKLELDPDQIVLDKLAVTETKYPIEKAFGQSKKYDQLPD